MKEIIFNIKTDTGNSLKNIDDLEKHVTTLKQKIKSVSDGDEFDKLSKQIIEADSKLKNINKSFEGMDAEKKAGEIGKLAGGLSAVGSAAALAFAGNEDAEQFFKTFAVGLSVTQAIKGSMEAYTSATLLLKNAQAESKAVQIALNIAMSANPAAIMVIAIAALTTALYLYSTNSLKAATSTELFNNAQQKTIETVGSEIVSLNNLTDVLKSENTSRYQKLNAIKELNTKYPEFLGNIDLEKITQEDLNIAIKKQTELLWLQAEAKAVTELLSEQFRKKLELEAEITNGVTLSIQEQVIGVQNLNQAIKNKELAKNIELININKTIKGYFDIKKSTDEQIGSLTKLTKTTEELAEIEKKRQEAIKAAQDAAKTAEDFRKKQGQTEKDEAKEARKNMQEGDELIAKVQKESDEANKKSQENRTKTTKENSDNRIKIYEEEQDKKKRLADEETKLLDESRQKFSDYLNNMSSELNKLGPNGQIFGSVTAGLDNVINTFNKVGAKLEEKVAAISSAIGGVIQSAIASISSSNQEQTEASLTQIDNQTTESINALDSQLKNGLINQEEYEKQKQSLEQNSSQRMLAIKKKAFEDDKKYKIASTIVAGLTGAVAAFTGAMQLGPIAGPIVGGSLAAIIAAMTAINVDKIASTQFNSGASSGGGGGGSAPQPSTPNMQSLFATQKLEGAETEQISTGGPGSNQIVKAVVVERDITDVQNRISNFDKMSEIG